MKINRFWLLRFVEVSAAALLALALLAAIGLSVGLVNRPGQHWANMFRPAALTFAAGGNPYHGSTSAFFNPPWVLIPLMPLAAFPVVVGQVALALACCLGLFVAARRLGAGLLVSAVVVLLPQTLFMYGYVNLDWLAPLGLLLPAPLGLFLVLAKPQLGVGIAAYWLAWAWRRGGLFGVARTFGPLALAGVWSVLAYGPWFLSTDPGRLAVADWSLTFWPWTVPLGLLLIGLAIRRQRPGLALFGGALLSPYMAFYSWNACTVGLLGERRRAALVLAVLLVIGVNYWG